MTTLTKWILGIMLIVSGIDEIQKNRTMAGLSFIIAGATLLPVCQILIEYLIGKNISEKIYYAVSAGLIVVGIVINIFQQRLLKT